MINGQIRDKEVRVIAENGDQLGVMPVKEAMKLAQEAELDSGQDCSKGSATCMQDYRLW